MWGTGRAVGEQGLRKVKTKALLFVGTKETKGCGKKRVIACWKAVGKGAGPVGGNCPKGCLIAPSQH